MPELVARAGGETVGLVKIDIEGAELDVFSADTTWLHRVDALAVELHDRYRPGCTAAVETAVARAWPAYERSAAGEKALFVRSPRAA
jgi:hypothetical protein